MDEIESSEESNDTHIPNFMRKLTSGMTVPDMAPDVVYLQNHPNDNNVNQSYSKSKSSKTANHHLDYAEDLYKKEMREKLENEDYIDQTKKPKITVLNDVEINNIPKSKELIEESLRKLGNQGKDGAELLRKLKEVFKNDLSYPINETESTNILYQMIENAMADDNSSWRGPRLRHYRNRFKRSIIDNEKKDRENLSKELFKPDQQNDAAIEEVR